MGSSSKLSCDFIPTKWNRVCPKKRPKRRRCPFLHLAHLYMARPHLAKLSLGNSWRRRRRRPAAPRKLSLKLRLGRIHVMYAYFLAGSTGSLSGSASLRKGEKRGGKKEPLKVHLRRRSCPPASSSAALTLSSPPPPRSLSLPSCMASAKHPSAQSETCVSRHMHQCIREGHHSLNSEKFDQ